MNRRGNPLGLGLLIVGATAMAIAAFLPLNEPAGVFRVVEHNTLIQRGGWMLIALAIGIAASGFLANQRKGNWLALPIVLCVVAAWGIFNLATNKNLRTLYPVEANGSLDTSQPGVEAPFGLAIYLAGVGVAVALIGSVMLAQTGRRTARQAVDAPAAAQARTKKCPVCTETILADAKVCKYCRYLFAPSALDARRN